MGYRSRIPIMLLFVLFMYSSIPPGSGDDGPRIRHPAGRAEPDRPTRAFVVDLPSPSTGTAHGTLALRVDAPPPGSRAAGPRCSSGRRVAGGLRRGVVTAPRAGPA